MSERSDNTIELGALLDGELTADQRAEVEARIKSNPVASARLAALRADKEMLRRIYEPIAKRPIPREWLAIANGARPKAPKTSWRMVGSIAAAVLVVVLAATSYIEMRPPVAGNIVASGRDSITGSEKIVQEALNARREVTRPDRVVAVENSAKVDRYSAVLRSAVGFNAKVPDMRKAGYQLIGIKVYSRGAAQLAYRDSKKRVLTLYVRRSGGEVGFEQFPRDGLRVCVWQDNEVGMVAAGDMSTAAMQRLAVLAYAGLFT